MKNMNLTTAKHALDKIINKGRTHLYKPIQIAEILYYDRVGLAHFDINDVNSYRNASKQWRDIITTRLVGRVSTSTQKYQDNLFEDNAIPPNALQLLAAENRRTNGSVEAYIYYRFKDRLQDVIDAYNYLLNAEDKFVLADFLAIFEQRPGLKRSVDKAFEIVVYALFSAIVDHLRVEISLSINNHDPAVLADFAQFIEYVLGLAEGERAITMPAGLYRVGTTNAADRGLDIVTNYGPVVQVKHLRLDETLAEEIVDKATIDNVVIVCKTAEAKLIQSLLTQVGLGIRGIITQDDLEGWYHLCQTKYVNTIGKGLWQHLQREFEQEFPMLHRIDAFLNERNYQLSQLEGEFRLV